MIHFVLHKNYNWTVIPEPKTFNKTQYM